MMAQQPELAKIFLRGCADYDGLNDDEKTQFGFLMHATFRVMDVINYQSHHGTGDQTLWEYEKHTIANILSNPGCRRWWRERPFNFSDKFVDYIENEALLKYPEYKANSRKQDPCLIN